MLSNTEPTNIQANSDRENLLHLIEKIFPREEAEPITAYRAFCDLAASASSIKELVMQYQEQEDAPPCDIALLQEWAEEFSWRSRLREWKPIYEAYHRKLHQQREIQILQHWNSRRVQMLELVDKLLAKAEVMLKHPHVQKVVYGEVVSERAGQIIPTTTVIMPTKWQASDIATYQKTAMSLLQEIVGDRQLMIDRLHADEFIITDPTGNDDNDLEQYLQAVQRLEEILL
jgi:hypothetical protein